MTIVLSLLALGAIGFVASRMWTRFAAASGTLRERLWAVFDGSATIVVAKATVVSGAVLDALPTVASVLMQPEAKAALETYLPTQTMSSVMVVIGLVTLVARMRTLER